MLRFTSTGQSGALQLEQHSDSFGPLIDFTATVLDGTVYIVGGVTMTGIPERWIWRHLNERIWRHLNERISRHLNGTVFAFDASTNAWTTRAQLKIPRFRHAATAHDGKLYVTGGLGLEHDRWRDGGTLDSAEIYDPLTDTANLLPPLNLRRSFHFSEVRHGEVLVFGGRDADARSHLQAEKMGLKE